MERTVAEARERGYTETLFGRRRLIPELSARRNYRVRQAGERQAMNAGIQGLAADIFKVALVRLDDALEDEMLASRIILQVHDEVIVEVPPHEHDAVSRARRRGHGRRRRAARTAGGEPRRSARPGPTPRAEAERERRHVEPHPPLSETDCRYGDGARCGAVRVPV